MPLIAAKCTNCGAKLEVDNTKDAAVCPSCNTPFVVEKAINYYNSTNNINAEVVNVYGGNSPDFVIRAGELVEYNGAATEVVIPNTVTIIGGGAFEGCKGLLSVTIPNSVTTIGYAAFSGCINLKSITIPNSVTSFGSGEGFNAFYLSNLETVVIAAGTTSIRDETFSSCYSLKKVVIPDSVTSIGEKAFYLCENLIQIKIPKSVTFIGNHAFSGCSSLTDIVIPNSVTTIGDGAFSVCSNLTDIVIPNRVTTIADGAFESCRSLTSIVIPNGVTSIGNRAFYDCRNLTDIVIPDSVEKVGLYAFESCPNLKITASDAWKRAHRNCHHSLNTRCYIATAVYGSYDCPEVWTLRRYRDGALSKNAFGRAFIRCYYAVSPTVVRLFGKTAWFNKFFKAKLDKLVARLQSEGYESTPYRD